MSKSAKTHKAAPEGVIPQVPLQWDEEVQQIDLMTIQNNRLVKFALVNAVHPSYLEHIEIFQNYAYTHATLHLKPVIYEEIIYIVKHYPAWGRPYVSEAVEHYLQQACIDARGYLKKYKPIPLHLMANLIKLRAILFMNEDAHLETQTRQQPSLIKVPSVISKCSTESLLSFEEAVGSPRSGSGPRELGKELFSDDESLASEKEFDTATMDMVYNCSSLLMQGYISAMHQIRKEPVAQQRAEPRKALLFPWAVRYCEYKKSYKPKVEEKVSVPFSKRKSIAQTQAIEPSFKVIYILLIGFYDVHLFKELHNVGINLYAIFQFGGNEEEINRFDDSETEEKPLVTVDSFSKFLSPFYHLTVDKKESGSSDTSPQKFSDEYKNLQESLIMMFWINMEQLCDISLPYTKDIIWFHCPNVTLTKEEKIYGSNEYWKHGAKLFQFISLCLRSVIFLEKYHRLYVRSLDIHKLGEKPKVVSVGKMFYYNEALRPIPPECIGIGHILEGLLDEVCQRTCLTEQSCTKLETSNKNLKMQKLLRHILKKYKFSYMPADPISFFHTHPHITRQHQKEEVYRNKFETYDSNNLDLETQYYPKLKHQLKSMAIDHLKILFPALLWRMYHCEEDFEARAHSSHVYQTWLSFIKLTANDCQQRMAIEMCNAIKCKERTKKYTLCKLHNYFPKPAWVVPKMKSKQIDQESSNLTLSAPQKKESPKTGRFPRDFHWQEYLSSEVLLQQTYADFIYYDCFDHIYVPFLDKIILRFHDPTDEFGAAVYIWEENIRAPVGLYQFFKYCIFDDSKWLRALEDTLVNLDLFSTSENDYSDYSLNEKKSLHFEEIPHVLASIKTFEDIFLNSPFISTDISLTAFDLESRAGAGGTTTIFHSTEGLKVTVDVSKVFNTRTISLKVQGDDHTFILHANPAAPFLFHFEASNGIRIVFGKPITYKVQYSDKLITRKPRTATKEKVYMVNEVSRVTFGERSKFATKRYVTEKSLKNLLRCALTQVNSTSSVESLKEIESGHKIVVKSTTSLTNISKRSNLPPIYYETVYKDLRNAKKATIPHFRIISSTLHKRKYVILSPATIILKFADYSIPIKFKPNINVAKRIEFSKCNRSDLPFQDVDSTKELKIYYDIRITIPSGLQIVTYPDPSNPFRYVIIQSYATTGPMNAPVKDEVSRTFTSQGYIRTRYRDGSIKMIGINGRSILGRIPCFNRKPMKRKPKVYTENLGLHKYIKLQKNIHKKINRFQKRLIDKPGVKYLNQKLTKRDRYFKTLLDGFMNEPCLLDYTKLTTRELLSPIAFKIPKHSFSDHYKFNFSTKDSFTSINDDGEQITTFTDGTRISSWFKIRQEMIVIPTEDYSGILEIDPDDYTCNFLIPKTGGWVDVTLFVQFEHPQYGTVTFNSNSSEVTIFLPDNIEVRFKSDGTYFVNLNDSMYADVTTERIKIKSNFCKKCYDSCETEINISHLYANDEYVPPNNILLEARDNFEKHFKVEYSGLCHRSSNYYVGVKKSCINHRTDTMEKFYSFDRNLKGIAYWTNAMLMDRILAVRNKSKREHVKYYLDDEKIVRAYEIISYYSNHYCDRFLMPYRKPDPPALQGFYLNPKETCFGSVAYIKKRLVELLPNPEAIMPLLNVINESNIEKPWLLHLPTREMVRSPPQPTHYQVTSTENINLRLPPHFAEKAIEHFKRLNKLATNFKIGLLEDVDGFTKDISHSICECSKSSRAAQLTSAHSFGLTYENYHYLSSRNRLKMAWSHVDSAATFPVVPFNSRMPTPAESYATVLLAKKDESAKELSVLEFSSQYLPLKASKRAQHRKVSERSSNIKEGIQSGSAISPLLKLGVQEWRKANLDVSSSSTSSEHFEPIKKSSKWKKPLKNKATLTSHPFDLLELQEPRYYSAINQGMTEKVKPVVKKKSSVRHTGTQLSKDGVKSIDNVSKIYKQVIELKNSANTTTPKRSYTETRRPKPTDSKIRQEYKLTGPAPLILKKSQIRFNTSNNR